jgi:hypothetical protein
LAAYKAGLAIDERLAAGDPHDAQSQRDLFVSLLQVTQWLLEAGDRAAAQPTAQRLDAQARLLAEHFPQDPERDGYLRTAADLLARVSRPASFIQRLWNHR